MAGVVDLLSRPMYYMGDVDRVLGLHGGTAKRWIDGYQRNGRDYDPVVRENRTGDLVVTWGEFVEARLLAEYRSAQVPMVKLRATVERLRARLNTQYPLAHASTLLEVQGREIVERVQNETGTPGWLVIVRNGQLGLDYRAESFTRSAHYDDDIVQKLRPVSTIEEVWVNPLMRDGEPVVNGVPTSVLAEMFRAGDSIDNLADWYELDVREVEAALRYERVTGTAA